MKFVATVWAVTVLAVIASASVEGIGPVFVRAGNAKGTEVDAGHSVGRSASTSQFMSSINVVDIEDAVHSLSSIGVVGFCHPSSDEFAPLIPLCEDSSDVPERRRLEAGANKRKRQLESEGEEEVVGEDEEESWFYIQNGIMASVCVILAALAAGLTMGLVSLDPLDLRIKIRTGATELERKQAASLLPLILQHHRLLVTLLLLNSIANEALPLFLDKLVSPVVAVMLSVTLLLFFGEILPSALFTGPNQIAISSHLTPLVRTVMVILCPIAYPIAKLLDVWLPDEHTVDKYNRGELSALVRIQYEERMAAKKRRKSQMYELADHHRRRAAFTTGTDVAFKPEDHMDYVGGIVLSNRPFKHDQLKSDIYDPRDHHNNNNHNYYVHHDFHDMNDFSIRTVDTHDTDGNHRSSIGRNEVNMVEGALSMKTKCTIDVYTPLRQVFAVPSDQILDDHTLVSIYSRGYSRIPIYERRVKEVQKSGTLEVDENDISAICGILLTKQLIVVNPEDKRPVSTLPLQQPVCVSPKTNLADLIDIMQTGGKANKGGHMALVCAKPDLATKALDNYESIPEEAGVMGIVTLEDAIEEILQEEIYDEMDHLEQEQARRVKRVVDKWKVFVRKRRLERENAASNEDQVEPRIKDIVLQAAAAAERAAEAAVAAADAATSAIEDGNTGHGDDGENEVEDLSSPLLPTSGDRSSFRSGSYGSTEIPQIT